MGILEESIISAAEIEYMMEMADKHGLCFNCFHTAECCAGRCDSPTEMGHICEGPEDLQVDD